jgi:predicted DNA binding CopG/RHH family protein
MVKDGKTSSKDLIGTHIRLTAYHLEKGKKAAAKRGMSLAQFIRMLIEQSK